MDYRDYISLNGHIKSYIVGNKMPNWLLRNGIPDCDKNLECVCPSKLCLRCKFILGLCFDFDHYVVCPLADFSGFN